MSLGRSQYSKATANPIRVVLAVAESSRRTRPSPTWPRTTGRLRVATEYPELTRRALAEHGVEAEISLSYGATEAKVPDIADCVVEITETGRALRAAGLRIIETLLVSHTELIANPASPRRPRQAPRHGAAPHPAAGDARGPGEGARQAERGGRAPGRGDRACCPPCGPRPCPSCPAAGGYALETVVPKAEINTLIPALKDQGATDIFELALSKIVH